MASPVPVPEKSYLRQLQLSWCLHAKKRNRKVEIREINDLEEHVEWMQDQKNQIRLSSTVPQKHPRMTYVGWESHKRYEESCLEQDIPKQQHGR